MNKHVRFGEVGVTGGADRFGGVGIGGSANSDNDVGVGHVANQGKVGEAYGHGHEHGHRDMGKGQNMDVAASSSSVAIASSAIPRATTSDARAPVSRVSGLLIPDVPVLMKPNVRF